MKKISKLLLSLFLVLGISAANANSGGSPWDKAPDRSNDPAALQRGAKLFTNYCLSCHSASFVRFNRLRDLGLTDAQIKDHLLFTSDKVGNMMQASIDPKQAAEWFGAAPPDLSLITRSRSGAQGTGADYVYTLLRSYYQDAVRPTGWNNTAMANIAMPHPLWELQGPRAAVHEKEKMHGVEQEVFKGYEQLEPGKMSAAEYDNAVGDLVAFLTWMGEPDKNSHTRTGVWVLIGLLVFLVIAWRLNASFWKDVK